jgi:dephospho-CoA kinase
MKKIGITGGIGSGKTTVCNIFDVLGVPVFHADEVARVLQDMDADIRSGMIDLFGEAIYFANGKLDRKKVAALIFNNPALKNKVNLLVHPKVKKNFLDWTAKNQSEDYILYEAAILFETGSYSGFDYNILVTASEQVRIDRVVKRDHTNEEAVLDRIRNQMSDEEKIPLADFIIENNEKQLIIPQIVHLDKIFRNNGKIR